MKRGIRAGITFNVLAIGLATVAPAGYAGPALPNSGTLTWSIRPTEVVPRTGEATAGQLGRTAIREFDPYPLAAAVNTVQATIDATIPAGSQAAVDIRGLRGDGTWSEWVEIIPNTFAVLPERTCSVQTRLVLTAPTGSAVSTVRSIDLAAWDAGGTASTRSTAAGDTYTVFATRKGLVGRTTANGMSSPTGTTSPRCPPAAGWRARTAATTPFGSARRTVRAARGRRSGTSVRGTPRTTTGTLGASHGRICRRASRRRRRRIRTATTVARTSSAERSAIRPASTSPTARSGTGSSSLATPP